MDAQRMLIVYSGEYSGLGFSEFFLLPVTTRELKADTL